MLYDFFSSNTDRRSQCIQSTWSDDRWTIRLELTHTLDLPEDVLWFISATITNPSSRHSNLQDISSSHILSNITYASTLWDSSSWENFIRMNFLYRKASKLMITFKSLSTDGNIRMLDVLPLHTHLTLCKCVFNGWKIRCTCHVFGGTKNRPPEQSIATSKLVKI